ncbi:MAG: hypothetical protein LBB76_02655, partial [Azoarcus sp.]|nr:hypothetical protein [Azoarcus sp.]
MHTLAMEPMTNMNQQRIQAKTKTEIRKSLIHKVCSEARLARICRSTTLPVTSVHGRPSTPGIKRSGLFAWVWLEQRKCEMKTIKTWLLSL